MNTMDVYLESGKKRVFAGAIGWPGWCRSGRDEQSALQALLDSASGYARVLEGSGLAFDLPWDLSVFQVVEQVAGNATTDFGAPNIPLSMDTLPLDEGELQHLTAILSACWSALDRVVQQAAGKSLRLGPRGGGRDLERILEHVLGAEGSYLSALGGKRPDQSGQGVSQQIAAFQRAALDGLSAAARGEVAPVGPRGGKRWLPRTYARRSAWHILDHVWEIEDRVMDQG